LSASVVMLVVMGSFFHLMYLESRSLEYIVDELSKYSL
jgi:hypothetical protein